MCIAVLISSCETISTYYQIYKTIPEENMTITSNIIFEDSICIISYNLWTDGGDYGFSGGNIGFSIYNKTDDDITLDLTKSFFIMNDESFDYFQNSTVGKSYYRGTIISNSSSGVSSVAFKNIYLNNSNGKTVTQNSSSANSIQYNEKPLRTIPSKTFVFDKEFNLVNERYGNCD